MINYTHLTEWKRLNPVDSMVTSGDRENDFGYCPILTNTEVPIFRYCVGPHCAFFSLIDIKIFEGKDKYIHFNVDGCCGLKDVQHKATPTWKPFLKSAYRRLLLSERR